jgi:hypothetical protein
LEGKKRGYKFDIKKILPIKKYKIIKITTGQLNYEFYHLLKKLKIRDKKQYLKIKNIKKILPNKIFKLINGKIESWEKINFTKYN